MSGRWPVFVHGTTLSDQPDAVLLPGARRTAAVEGQLWAMPSGRSALVLEPGRKVEGELVDPVPDRVLGMLDLMEGVGEGQTRRELVDVVVGLRRERAWTWVTEAARARVGRRVPDGRWRPVRRRGDQG
ncbi:MAG: gamma-glutamylcyclotransferase [Alphaproteobacteria bacterium]|nr:gamma-glutamylcyclotransferase [Alphaproteobacteria bacterium]MCB9695789.1 gamma-glutamylcyclotransferase [Alphaproteobacteria bacterium]